MKSERYRVSDLFDKNILCGICDHRILKVSHANIDHIVPLSRGGEDTRANTQIVHRWCNQYKGGRLEGEYPPPTFAWNLKCMALFELGLIK
jgi:5-methylcytosine-specific restriction endonuclease McrA